MKVNVPEPEEPFTVGGTEIRPGETSEQYLQKLARIALDEASFLVAVLTKDGVLLDCNRAVLEAGGLTREDAIGKPLWETFWLKLTPRTRDDLCAAISRAAQGESVRHDVEGYSARDGKDTRLMDFSVRPVRDQRGNVVYLLSEARDLTEVRPHGSERQLPEQPARSGSAAREDAPLPAPSEGAAQERARVLVVHHEADMRERLRRILEPRWRVDLAGDAVRALQTARELHPDVILSDVVLPAPNGFGLVRELRADPTLAATPLIMLSVGEEPHVEGLEAGADDYLVKPFSARKLVARVASAIETSRLRRTLQAERERLVRLFESAPAVICVLRGPEHVFELANPQFLRFTGKKDLVGQSARTAFPEVEGQGYFELLDRVYRTGTPCFADESPALIDTNGDGKLEELFVSYTFYPSRTPDGDVDGVFVLGVDVTQHVIARRRAEEQRRVAEAAQAKAEAASRMRDEFLLVASHELRTPLTTLGLRIDGLLRDLSLSRAESDMTRLLHKAERIREQANRLEQLADSLIDVFSLGRVELNCEPVDLSDIVRRAINHSQPAAALAHARIELSAARVMGQWDPKRIDQILMQLLSNAIKFGAGSAVEVAVEGDETTARIKVVDHGIGIPPEHHERILGRFERAAPASNYSGFGLGLWVVHELVAAMRGSVRVQSEPGRGSTFIVELPKLP